MPRNGKPGLNIGLPVYNGELYLGEALDSLLSQTYEDFELIISDNASTDATRQICQDYMARDQRIRYYRNELNLGAAANFNRVFELSNAEYFKWAAHDDLYDPNFLKKCIETLHREPSIILAFTKTKIINENDEVIGSYETKMYSDAFTPHERFHDLILASHPCTAAMGVVRRGFLSKTPLIGKYLGSDRNLLAELGLFGRLYEIPEYLFYRRDHFQVSMRKYDTYERLAWFDPSKKIGLQFPHWKTGFEYFRSVTRVALKPYEKYWCYRYLAFWFVREQRHLKNDLVIAANQIFPQWKKKVV